MWYAKSLLAYLRENFRRRPAPTLFLQGFFHFQYRFDLLLPILEGFNVEDNEAGLTLNSQDHWLTALL